MDLTLRTLLILLLALATPLAGATAQNHTDALPLGLERLTWGMTIDAAERAFPHLHPNNQYPDPNVVRRRLDHFPLAGCDFSLSLEFHHGGLNAISLEAGHNIQACANQVKADLFAKYGPGGEASHADLGVNNIDWHGRTIGEVIYSENAGYILHYPEKHLLVNFWRPGAYFRILQ